MVLVSVKAANRSFLERLALNHSLVDNAYWRYPVDDAGHENYVPVGRGQVTSPLCGRWKSFRVCDRTDLHKGVVLKGVDYTDKLVVTHEHLWCNKSSCPVCFNRGWAAREARSVTGRLAAASERGYGEVEHIVVSVPPVDRNLSEAVLREKCMRAMLVRGVLGGAMIFHGFRIDKVRKVLVWSPHFHCLGFISGGFDVCRECVHERGDCRSCNAFKGREVREYAKDGYLVTVQAKRKTVFGTAWYQLNHATLRMGLKRFHVVTYFGVCGCSKLKGKKLKPDVVCPACGSDMPRRVPLGFVDFSKDVGDPNYRKVFPCEEFRSDGSPVFADACGGRVE